MRLSFPVMGNRNSFCLPTLGREGRLGHCSWHDYWRFWCVRCVLTLSTSLPQVSEANTVPSGYLSPKLRAAVRLAREEGRRFQITVKRLARGRVQGIGRFGVRGLKFGFRLWSSSCSSLRLEDFHTDMVQGAAP